MVGCVEIVEGTLRDGSYAIDQRFTAEDTFLICRALEDADYTRIEVGQGVGLGAPGPQFGVAARGRLLSLT
jgi:4-hydroxy 2-oxovalerate aldolase/long-chain acyl-CoA synthetase